MLNKTKLEHDLAQYEKTSVPILVRILLILFVISICSLVVYAVKLHQEIQTQEEAILSLKEHHKKEKSDLLKQIMILEQYACPESSDMDVYE